MIKSWNQFNENRALYKHSLVPAPEPVVDDSLLYYAFDWDDNILHMPTVIHMERLVDGEWLPTDVSTADFAVVRGDTENYRILNGDPAVAFEEFGDKGPRGIESFLKDVKQAIAEKRYAPAWDDFIECLTSGALFAIITARGHEPEAIRLGIEYIIDNVLTDGSIPGGTNQKQEMYDHLRLYLYMYKSENIDEVPRLLENLSEPSKDPIVKAYLDNCDLVGVSAPSRSGSASNPEEAKEEALMQFADKADRFASMIGKKARIGFSDDDPGNVRHITELAKNLHHERFANIISFTVKDTNKPEVISTTFTISEQRKFVRTFDKFPRPDELKSEGIDPMQASTVSMWMPNAPMSGELDMIDPYAKSLRVKTKALTKMTKDLSTNPKMPRRKKSSKKP